MTPWDDGLWDSSPNDFWDIETNSSPQPTRMFDINLNLKNINATTLVGRVRAAVLATTGNAAFPTPDPTLATLTAKADALAAKVSARDAAKAAAKTLTQEADDLLAETKSAFKQFGAYVGRTATSEAQVQSATLEVRAQPVPKSLPDRIEGLDMTPTDNDGELDAQWDPDDDATGYDVESNEEPLNPATWKHQCTCTDSRVLLKGFTSGGKVAVRVRGRNSAGTGPWSDVAVRRTA